MLFCKECKSLMIPKKKGSKNVMGCSSCSYVDDGESTMLKEQVKDDGKRVEVVHREIETLPLVEAECPACHYDKAYFWEIQTRASDEPATKFYKCEKCKKIWRDYK